MSLLVCPLCGKSSILASYDPSGFALDVYARDVRGLGRGRGFQNLGRRSIVDDPEALSGMSQRIVDLVGLFFRKGLISREEVVGEVGGEVADSAATDERDAEFADLEDEVDLLADRLWKAVETNEEDGEAPPLKRLQDAVNVIIDELDAAKALEESEGEEG